MKTINVLLTMALAVTLSAATASAQDNYTKQEKREISRDIKDSNKDLYKKVDRDVKKEARKLAKEGWKSMDLPIEKQLERTWEREWQTDVEGYDKYISKTVSTVGQNYSSAVRQAENVAKLSIASDMGTLVQSMVTLAIGNNEITPEQAASINQSVEKVKLLVNEKLGRVLTSTVIYRVNHNVYEVRITVLYSQKAALMAASQAAQAQLRDDMKVNDAEFDALFGYDKLRNQYIRTDWDETIQ